MGRAIVEWYENTSVGLCDLIPLFDYTYDYTFGQRV